MKEKKSHRRGNLRLSHLQGLRATEPRLEPRSPQFSIFHLHVFPKQQSVPLVVHEILVGTWLGIKEHQSTRWKSHCLLNISPSFLIAARKSQFGASKTLIPARV